MAFDQEPTHGHLEKAWLMLQEAGVTQVCDLSLAELAAMVRGAPPHDPTRYTYAERKLAAAVLVLRAALVGVV